MRIALIAACRTIAYMPASSFLTKKREFARYISGIGINYAIRDKSAMELLPTMVDTLRKVMENTMTKSSDMDSAERERTKRLAAAIMLQAMEDIWLPAGKRKSMEFFNGEGFNDCADIVGMSLYERNKVLEFVQAAYNSTVLLPLPNTSFKMVWNFFPQHPDLQN